MFDRLAKLFRKSAAATTEQTQREALVDVLVLLMFIDRHIASAERDAIQKLVDDPTSPTWESTKTYPQFLDASIRRTRDVVGSEQATRAYLEDISSRLATDEQRRAALVACRELADADGDRAEAEEHLLQLASEVFAQN